MRRWIAPRYLLVLIATWLMSPAPSEAQTNIRVPATRGDRFFMYSGGGGADACGSAATLSGTGQDYVDDLNALGAPAFTYQLGQCSSGAETGWDDGPFSTVGAPAWCQPEPNGVEFGENPDGFRCDIIETTTSNGSQRLFSNYADRHIECPPGSQLLDAGGNQHLCGIRVDATCPVGNPVSPTTGQKFHSELDYTSAGAMPLVFERFYYSGHFYAPNGPTGSLDRGVLGDQWNHTYGSRLYENIHSSFWVAVVRPNGQVWFFDVTGKELFNRDRRGASARMQKLPNGTWQLTLSNHDVERYDTAGLLTSITKRSGQVTTVSRSAGQITTVSDGFGRTLTFGYNAAGRLASVTTPANQTISFTYETSATSWQDGRLKTVQHPDLSSRSYDYGGVGYWLTGINDELGHRQGTYTYSDVGEVTSSEKAGGVNRHTYSYTGSATTIVDPANRSRVLSFQTTNGTHRRTTLTGGEWEGCGYGDTTGMLYDAQGNISERTDFAGVKTSYTFDTTRNLEISRTEGVATAKARTITTTWDTVYRLPLSIKTYTGSSASGTPLRIEAFTLDTAGNVLTRTLSDPASGSSRTWTYTYDTLGRVLTENGPRTDVSDLTTYTYYACSTGFQCGQIHTATNGLNHVTTYNTYNAHGQPLTMTDPNGVVTTLTYDSRQRLTSHTVGTEQSTYEYWSTGLPKKTTLPDGSYLEYTYDDAQRLTDINDAEGNRTHYVLDAAGNRTGEELRDPSNVLKQTSTRVFNTLNQLQQEIGAAGTANVTTSYGYDNNGNLTSINAPLNRNTTQTYDVLNRLSTVTDPNTGLAQYAYNALDQLISVTDPKGLVTSYTYNALGDLQQQVSPDTGTTTHTYDSGGNLTTRTDARSAITTYAYDALNRVTSAEFKTGSTIDQTLLYTYDAGTHGKGQLTGASDSAHSLSWTYDDQGRVLSANQTVGTVSKAMIYTYANGRRQTMTTPSGQVISYTYTNGKVTSIRVNGTVLVSNILYEPFGAVRQWTWSNGSVSVRTFDQDGKITQINSASLKNYSYDDAFRITGVTDPGNSALSWTYGYDNLDRLTSASKTGTTLGYTYDANGNRLTQTGASATTFTVAASSNRLSSTTGALARTYSYDNAGNTTGYTGITFTYNNRGRMKSSTKSGITTNYTYNALGQLIKKGSNALYYYDDAGHILGTYNGTGGLIEEIVWLGDIPINTIRAKVGGGINIYNIHTDHLNTPRQIVGSINPGARWIWNPDPFGVGTVNNNPSGVGAFDFHLRFPGQIYFAETGLNYNYFRDYDPQIGRYIESDPIGLVGGLNTYHYAQGSPTMYADPKGLDATAPAIPRPSPVVRPFPRWLRPPNPWLFIFWPRPLADSDLGIRFDDSDRDDNPFRQCKLLSGVNHGDVCGGYSLTCVYECEGGASFTISLEPWKTPNCPDYWVEP